MNEKDIGEIKEIISEVHKSENPGWLRLTEKILIPILLGFISIILGLVSWNTNVSLKELEEAKYESDSIATFRNFQLDLMQLFYKDITSDQKSKRRNAGNLLALMDSSLERKISSMNWKIEQTLEDSTAKTASFISLNNYLLHNSSVRIYYAESAKKRAAEIDSLLNARGADSKLTGDIKTISSNELKTNQIVYFNTSQIRYCNIVAALFGEEKIGEKWLIRESSVANSYTDYFKIYVAQ